MTRPLNVVFDLGGVLFDWNPRYLYRKLTTSEKEVEDFLANICTSEWNSRLDRGTPFKQGVEELCRQHPEKSDWIKAYQTRWPEMVGGVFDENVQLLTELHQMNVPLYSITNWSSETFESVRQNYPFMKYFDDIVVSGEEKITKPDPRIYKILLDRNSLKAEQCIFIDDVLKNIEGAKSLGFKAIQAQTPTQLRHDLFEIFRNGY